MTVTLAATIVEMIAVQTTSTGIETKGKKMCWKRILQRKRISQPGEFCSSTMRKAIEDVGRNEIFNIPLIDSTELRKLL